MHSVSKIFRARFCNLYAMSVCQKYFIYCEILGFDGTQRNLVILRRAKWGWILNGGVSQFVPKCPVCPVCPPLSFLGPRTGCGIFAYSWKLPAYSGAFVLTINKFSFFTYNWSFFAYSFSFFTYNWSFFAYSGKVRLISALRDCKPRSLTVSKKAQTVSKKASPAQNGDKPRQKRTNGDRMGHFGTNWETPTFGIHPRLALLNTLP